MVTVSFGGLAQCGIFISGNGQVDHGSHSYVAVAKYITGLFVLQVLRDHEQQDQC